MKPIDKLKKIASIPKVISSKRALMGWKHFSKDNSNIRLFTRGGLLYAQERRLVNYYSGAKWVWVTVYRSYHRTDLKEWIEMIGL